MTKFVPSSTYKLEEETLKVKQISYPPNPKPSFNPKRAQKQTTNSSMPNLDRVYTCMFCGRDGHLVEFCFHRINHEHRLRAKDFRNSHHIFHDMCGSKLDPNLGHGSTSSCTSQRTSCLSQSDASSFHTMPPSRPLHHFSYCEKDGHQFHSCFRRVRHM